MLMDVIRFFFFKNREIANYLIEPFLITFLGFCFTCVLCNEHIEPISHLQRKKIHNSFFFLQANILGPKIRFSNYFAPVTSLESFHFYFLLFFFFFFTQSILFFILLILFHCIFSPDYFFLLFPFCCSHRINQDFKIFHWKDLIFFSF